MEESVLSKRKLEEDTFEGTIRPDSIDEYIGQSEVKENLKVFIEKLDITCINELIEKVGKFYEDNCIEPVENDIREKAVEKFKKIIKFSKILYSFLKHLLFYLKYHLLYN